jgi:hypothetical protein
MFLQRPALAQKCPAQSGFDLKAARATLRALGKSDCELYDLIAPGGSLGCSARRHVFKQLVTQGQWTSTR